MITDLLKQKYYQVLLDNKSKRSISSYEGVFFVGIKTTGIFCRPTCPARKPLFENCLFFHSTQEALSQGFWPCKRCKPLTYPSQASQLIDFLIKTLEKNPQKRWREADFQKLGSTVSTVQRQFKKRFGMTFAAYARAQRIGSASKHIQEGQEVIEAQVAAGYESGSGFRDAFSRITGTAPRALKQGNYSILKASWLDTQLGPMVVIADEYAVYLLEFADRRYLEREIEHLKKKTGMAVVPGRTEPIDSIEVELKKYFAGELYEFKTPYRVWGSSFEKSVWQVLEKIPYGQTCSYAQVAQALGKPSAFRAVANAVGSNNLALMVPCHRVINSNGGLGGYAAGIERKRWLLKHERAGK